jgi:hypothetical protein
MLLQALVPLQHLQGAYILRLLKLLSIENIKIMKNSRSFHGNICIVDKI